MELLIRSYFYKLLAQYISLFLSSNSDVIEINPRNDLLQRFLKCPRYKASVSSQFSGNSNQTTVILNGNLHYESDIQLFLENLRNSLRRDSRVFLIFFSSLWRPFIKIANFFGIRSKTPEQNWISPEDIQNFLILSGYELVRIEQKILVPFYIPFLSAFLNRFVAPLPFFRSFTLVNLAMARPIEFNEDEAKTKPSVSIIVPARNEEGNIPNIPKRIPKMGPNDELIFIEGNSTDKTWERILETEKNYSGHLKVLSARQEGKGKGDAVRKGFSIATREILMILDADLTVPPEELPKFYEAIISNKGEFINGSRLVYPMEGKAMRFFNIIGNKFFALAFSFVLGQKFKDTLCGTKVISKSNYNVLVQNRSFFGNFDPFGDFDLIFGSSKMGLKIIEIPIPYKDRVYGETNISRWKHGMILLAMLVFSAKKIKFT